MPFGVGPKRVKQSAFAKLDDFIHWLERSNPEYTGPKYWHAFPELPPFECAELREKIRVLVQEQRMTTRRGGGRVEN